MIIQKRTVFNEVVDGTIRFHDWALVVTPVGSMVEPFQEIGLRATTNIDWTDEMTKINEIKNLPTSSEHNMYTSGVALIGGTLMRTGR